MMMMSSFIETNNFATRFDDFRIPSEVMRFVKVPFCVSDFVLKGTELAPSLDEGFLQLELTDVQALDESQQSLQQTGSEKFWTWVISPETFPHLHFFFSQRLAQRSLVSAHSYT